MRQRRPRRPARAALAASLAAAATVTLSITAPASAVTYTWVGGTGLAGWSSLVSSFPVIKSNWNVSPNFPISGPTTDIVLQNGGGASSQDLANPFTLNSLTFNGASFNLSGLPLSFVADGPTPPSIQQLSTFAQTISNQVQLGTDLTIQANGPTGASLTFSGGIVSATSSPGLALNVNANSVNGTVVFASPVTVDGGTTLNSGTLRVAGTGTLGGDFVPLTVNANGAVDSVLEVNNMVNAGSLAGSFTTGRTATVKINTGARLRLQRNASTTFRGQFQGAGELQTAGTNYLTLQGVTGSLGSISTIASSYSTLDGGTLTLDKSSIVGNALSVADNSSFQLFNGATLNTTAGTAVAAGYGTGIATISLTNAGTTWAANRIVIGDGDSNLAGLLVFNRAAVTASNSLDVGAGAGVARGILRINSGGTVTSTSGTIGSTTSTGEAYVTDANSRWTVANRLTVGGDTAAARGTLSISAGGEVNANLTDSAKAGSINIDQGRLTTNRLDGYGQIHLLRDPAGGAALNITNPSGTFVAFAGTTDGPGSLTKSGDGTQTLSGRLAHTGPTTVNAGNLIVTGQIDAGAYTVNTGGTLTLASNSATVGFGQLLANTGGVVDYQNATVFGGFLRGAGLHRVAAGTATTFNGSTIVNGATLTAAGPTTLNNVTSTGQVLNPATATLTWSGGFNNGGTLTVNGNADLSAFNSSGVIQVNAGGTLTNADTPLLLGGGSRTTIAKGAALNLKSSTIELSGGLLTNDGTIDGTTNVRFNALATGTGKFGPVNVFDNGRFAPGATASPAVFSTAAVQAEGAASFASQSALAVQIAGPKPGDGHDQLAVSANATLAGRLEVSTSPNYTPTGLTPFPVLTFASRTGVFTQYTGLDLPGPLFYAPVYSARDLRLIPTVPGDADVNGRVNFDDLLALAKNYNALLPSSGPGDNWWNRGDFNLDGTVNFDDLLVLAKNYNGTATPAAALATLSPDFAAAWSTAQAAAVPEPTTPATLLLLLGTPTLLRRHRRTLASAD